MISILTEILNGQVKPLEKIGKDCREIDEVSGFAERNYDTLYKTLNDEQKETFKKYSDCLEKYYTLLIDEAFSVGFSLSTRILTESLIKSEKLYIK